MTGAILALLLSTSEWTPQDTAVQVATSAVCVTDVALTSAAIHSGVIERNPVLGRSPSQAKLWTLGLTGCAVQAGISWLLPKPWRQGWQAAWLSIEGAALVGNVVVLSGRW